MSTRAARWMLWIAFVLMVPVPFLMLGSGWVPAARLIMLGGISLAVALFENASGAVGMLSVILLAQGLLYMGLLWLAAHFASRWLDRFSSRTATAVTLVVVAAGVLIASTFELYRGPYRAQSPRANLLHVYE